MSYKKKRTKISKYQTVGFTTMTIDYDNDLSKNAHNIH